MSTPSDLLVRPGFSREITERASGDAAGGAVVGSVERRAGQRIDQRQGRDRGGGKAAGDLGIRVGVGIVFDQQSRLWRRSPRRHWRRRGAGSPALS